MNSNNYVNWSNTHPDDTGVLQNFAYMYINPNGLGQMMWMVFLLNIFLSMIVY